MGITNEDKNFFNENALEILKEALKYTLDIDTGVLLEYDGVEIIVANRGDKIFFYMFDEINFPELANTDINYGEFIEFDTVVTYH
jgi:hypothetical protein